jgi:hypothetical protein
MKQEGPYDTTIEPQVNAAECGLQFDILFSDVRLWQEVAYSRTLSGISLTIVTFEVFTAVTMNNGVFWDVTPCGPCKNGRFGGT